jgi:predicted tellurium resistance membrane protein TerC
LDDDDVTASSHVWAAVRIVVVADIVMSLDNVIAVAAAANGSVPLLIIGLAVSVPLIVAGSALIMALLTRLPILVWIGAALLGWIAGEVIATDPAIAPLLQSVIGSAFGVNLNGLLSSFGAGATVKGTGGEIICSVIGAVIVLIVGSILRKRAINQGV